MALDVKEVANQALKLSPDDRIELAEQLLESVDDFANSEIENHWRAIAMRRLTEYEQGRVEGESAASVHQRIRTALHENRLPSGS